MRQCTKTRIATTAALAAVLTFSWAAHAQSASCPIQPTLVKNVDSQLAIQFDNVSGKQIATYGFGLTFFDLNGKAHPFPQPLAGKVQLSARGHRSAIWQSRLAQLFLYPYAQAFLQQVTFTDGTSWVDDGSHACSIISVQE
jgi:hypothetical protein